MVWRKASISLWREREDTERYNTMQYHPFSWRQRNSGPFQQWLTETSHLSARISGYWHLWANQWPWYKVHIKFSWDNVCLFLFFCPATQCTCDLEQVNQLYILCFSTLNQELQNFPYLPGSCWEQEIKQSGGKQPAQCPCDAVWEVVFISVLALIVKIAPHFLGCVLLFVSVMLGGELRALCSLSKCSSTEVHSGPL